MGFWERRRRKATEKKYGMMLQNERPVFSSFGRNVYASDVVQSAIKCITDEMSKCQPMHVKQIGREVNPQDSDIARVLERPNDLMTCSDFITKIVYLYETQFNAWVYPQYEFYTENGMPKKKLVALFPIAPEHTEFYQDTNGELFVKFYFAESETDLIPYIHMIHWRKDFTENDYMGGDRNGRANVAAMLKVLQLNDTLIESLPNAIKSSYNINGVIKYASQMSAEKQKENLAKFNELIKSSQSGILATDMGGEFEQLQRDIKLVDEATLKFIDERILRFWKVPLSKLRGDNTPEQHEAFIQNTIEHKIISLGQAFTKTLFNSRESFGYGNKIVFYFDRIDSMSTEQKRGIIQDLGGRGALTNNYMLGMFGIPPYEGGNVRYMSLNYVDVNIANQYQLGRANTDTEKGGGENAKE